jgi:NAD(P)-dependent dehydrogenase (short-subunit alcohol dehydrogenase family)
MNDKRVIVITGVTRGLGSALANEFDRLGHTIVGCGRSRERVEETQRLLKRTHSISAVDVASDERVEAWAREAIRSYGPPDLLLNNAAVINRNAPLWAVSAEEFSAVVDVNIKGVANVIRHFVPAMVARRSGVIVNFSSGWGRSTSGDVAPYCATKWAIEGLTQALAQELPDGMAAVPLNPGIINTEMLQSCFGDSARSYVSPSEWARVAVPYLLRLSGRENGQPSTVPA